MLEGTLGTLKERLVGGVISTYYCKNLGRI